MIDQSISRNDNVSRNTFCKTRVYNLFRALLTVGAFLFILNKFFLRSKYLIFISKDVRYVL